MADAATTRPIPAAPRVRPEPGGPPLPPGRRVELPGRGRTFARDTGEPAPGAPTVLLLHGLGASADLNWFGAFEPLSARFRVVAVDHRGHGRGIRDRRRFRLADCADDAVALLDALGVDRAIVAGYSMGGPIAQLTWHRHRDRVAGLVLCATAHDFRSRRGMVVLRPLGEGMVRAFRLTPQPLVRGMWRNGLVSRRLAAEPWLREEVRRHSLTKMVEAGAALGRYSAEDWIGGVDVPTAVVVTSRDQAVPPRLQRGLAGAIPGATVHELDGDHLVVGTHPDRFAAALDSACGEVAVRAGALP